MTVGEVKIAIIGLGYVGLPLAVEFGKIRSVIGFDINEQRIAELKAGNDSTREVSRESILSSRFIEFSCNSDHIQDCGIFIITVPTPIDDANRPDLSPIIKASELVGSLMRVGALIIYESTVFPGCTEEICVPVLEKKSGLLYNKDFFCGYSPERINPGDKVNTLTTIKKITSGSTSEAADIVDSLYGSIIKAGTYKVGSIIVAEAAKVIENSQRDLNIAFVNELSLIFERLGIDSLEVLEAAGSKWNFLPFRPGLVGGHCIGVDPYYLTHKAEEVGYQPQVILAGRRINDNMSRHIAQNVVKRMLLNGLNVSQCTVCVMGITFKDNCPDIRNSKVVDLISELATWGLNVVVVDPWADPLEVKREYGIELGLLESLTPVDSLVVAVAHNEYKNLDPVYLRMLCRSDKPVLADVKSIYDRHAAKAAGFTLYRV